MSLSVSQGLAQANSLVQAGEKKQALHLLSQLLQENPNDARIWAMLAMLVNNPDKKRECLQHVIDLGTEPNMVRWAQQEMLELEHKTVRSEPAPVDTPVSATSIPSEPTPTPDWMQAAASAPTSPPDSADRGDQAAPAAPQRSSGGILMGILAAVVILLLFGVLSLVARRAMSSQNTPAGVGDVPTAEPAMTLTVAPNVTRAPTATPTNSPTPTATATITSTPTATVSPTPSEADLHVQAGDELRLAWKYAEAINEYTLALQLNPNLISAYIGRTRAQMNLDQWESALADINQIKQLNPNHPEGFLLEGVYMLEQGFPRNALELYDEAIAHDATYSRAYSVRGEYYLSVDNISRAESDFKYAIKFDPTNFAGYNGLGNIAMADEDYEEALEQFLKAGEVYPNEPVSTSNAGIVLIRFQRFDEAIEKFQQVIGVVPSYPYAHSGLAEAYYRIGRYQEAVAEYTLAADLGEVSESLYHGRALAHIHLDQFSEALADIDAIMTMSADGCIFNERCVINNGLGEYDSALADCTLAIERNGPNSAYLNRAIAYEGLGQTQDAIADYTIVIQLYPADSPEAIYAQERITALGGTAAICLPSQMVSCAPVAITGSNVTLAPFPIAVCELH